MAEVSASNPTATIPPNPTFSPNNITVVFILGGPGAGKGTQCTNLVEAMGFSHLSAGDLLRQEQDREGSEFGDLIREYIREGKIVPKEVTIQLLENAMKAVLSAGGSACDGQTGRFLIDGFPRKLDQAHAFEQQVCPAKLVLFFDCPEAELERRLLDRGKTSGRTDDNIKSIKKRFYTFVETSMPVIHYYEAQDKVIRVDAQQPVAAVFKDTIRLLGEHLLLL